MTNFDKGVVMFLFTINLVLSTINSNEIHSLQHHSKGEVQTEIE